VGIARALANRPLALLCDEATSALDPDVTMQILNLIQAIKERWGLTVVIITHEMRVITEICDRVAVMADGRVEETGSVIEVFTRPKREITRRFVETAFSREDASRHSGYKQLGTMLRVFFVGESADESLISNMIRRCDVEVNIQQGYIDHINGMGFGTLLIDMIGPPENRRRALEYLRSRRQMLEVANDV
jgi:D-methionine transport system ATP-binding protein